MSFNITTIAIYLLGTSTHVDFWSELVGNHHERLPNVGKKLHTDHYKEMKYIQHEMATVQKHTRYKYLKNEAMKSKFQSSKLLVHVNKMLSMLQSNWCFLANQTAKCPIAIHFITFPSSPAVTFLNILISGFQMMELQKNWIELFLMVFLQWKPGCDETSKVQINDANKNMRLCQTSIHKTRL